MVEQLIGLPRGKDNMKTYKLSDSCIAQIVRLIQLGILTGTDVSDQLRTFEVAQTKDGKLEPSPDFLENFENNLQKLADAAQEQEANQDLDQ